MSFDIILKYFPSLTSQQKKLYHHFYDLFIDINSKINLISRKDIANFYEHHVLHSLAIGKMVQFKNTDKVIDIGTGGGFPGIPLAILFPNTHFTLLDACMKKINAVETMIHALNLTNVTTICCRSEEYDSGVRYDYILGRAVTNINNFIKHTKFLLAPMGKILYLNGTGEYNSCHSKIYPLRDIFTESYFATKQLMIFENISLHNL